METITVEASRKSNLQVLTSEAKQDKACRVGFQGPGVQDPPFQSRRRRCEAIFVLGAEPNVVKGAESLSGVPWCLLVVGRVFFCGWLSK